MQSDNEFRQLQVATRSSSTSRTTNADMTSEQEEIPTGMDTAIETVKQLTLSSLQKGYEVQQEVKSQEKRPFNRRWYLLSFALILLGILLHQLLFIAIGVLVTLVLAIIDLWSSYCLQNVSYKRILSERRALFGEEITLTFVLENIKVLPLSWLELEDTVPKALPIKNQLVRTSKTSDSFLLDCLFSLLAYDRVTRYYTLYCNNRGVHTFGPTKLRSGDVFGFVNREAEIATSQFVLVYPLVVPITEFGLPARHPFGEHRAPRRLLEDPSRVVGIREYVYGDSLRRVNWKATARTMQMQSRIYEASTTYTLITFLDTTAQYGSFYEVHPDLQELMICAAASLAHWALDQKYAIGLYTNSTLYTPDEVQPRYVVKEARKAGTTKDTNRQRIRIPAASNETQHQRIMEALARVQSSSNIRIEEVLQTEGTHLPAGATIVVITATVSDLLADTLLHIRKRGHAVSILVVGDSLPLIKVAGVTIYHIGGKDTWKQFKAARSTGAEHYVDRLPELHL